MIGDRLRRVGRRPAVFLRLRAGAIRAALSDHGLFDARWYLAQDPEAAAAGGDPLRHFLRHGLAAGRDPSPLFSSEFYRASYPDVAASGLPPLVHYLFFGGREGRQPHPAVAPAWLAERLGPGQPLDNPLLGLMTTKLRIGPRPMFDLDLVAAALGLPPEATAREVLSAWFALAPAARPDPHPLFDAAWARVAARLPEGADAFDHYCRTRGLESRPHPLFDNDHVWLRHPRLRHAPGGLTLLDAALADPEPEAVSLTVLFDDAHYRTQLEPGAAAGEIALLHYLREGHAAGLDPNPFFDEASYRARYGHVMAGRAGLDHYMRHGREPWVTLAPRFDDRYYVTRHPEVADDYPGPPLAHYLAHGRAEKRQMASPLWVDDFASWEVLRADLRAGAARLGDPDPEVSVIVPVYNQFLYTLRCLWSILQAGDRARLQVILADDGSDDETAAFFGSLPGITYIRNPANLGFLRSCNHAAGAARAPFLFFLNNDTAVLPGWIDSLLALAREVPEAGIVGSKLVYPDGSLQEAGGFVWADGGGANLGRHADPEEPGYNLRRDADYISGAAILVPAAAWAAAGGFDDRYAPAYCEDTDLAMRLRQLGWRVLYQPTSTVIHFEGVSSGTSTAGGIKAHQVTNFATLRDRWGFALERHLKEQPIHPRAIPRPPRPRILVIDHVVPEPDRDAGSVIMSWHLRLLVGLGWDVTFVPRNLEPSGAYGRALQAMGVELIHQPYVRDLNRWLDAHAAEFDLFWLCRYGEGGMFIERLKALCPATPVIFAAADLHFLRAEREAALHGNPPAEVERALAVRARELQVIGEASDTVLVSPYEAEHLRRIGVRAPVSVIPLVLEGPAEVPPREGRHGIAFVGGYQHTPNVDAVLYFLDAIWPALHAARPDLEFHIVGSNPPAELTAIAMPGVVVQGYVADLDGFLGQRVATVVPLQYGAGIKGKIGSSLAAGVPVVTTTVGAEGMGLVHGREALIADRPADLAAAVLRLIDDPALWQAMSAAGRAFVEREYSPEATRGRLLRLLAKVGAAPFAGRCPISGEAETRRFVAADMPDAFARGAEGPMSSERIAAGALAALAGRPGVALARLRRRELPAVAVAGAMPRLARALERIGALADLAEAEAVAARIPLDDGAGAALAALIAELPATCRRLVLALPPVGMAPGRARAEPLRIGPLVLALEAAGWEVRSDRMPAAESALTGCVLVEARRGAPAAEST